MHVYIYDSYINQKKYDKAIAMIETRLTDLGLNGKIARLGLMKNIPDLVQNELKRGAKTITAVGNDQTVCQVINALAGNAAPLGIIPVGKNNNFIATSLGITSSQEACDILSARRIMKLDLGRANQNFFLANANITTLGTIVEIDQDYSIETAESGIVNIVNFTTGEEKLPISSTQNKFNPTDGILEFFIVTGQDRKFLKKITGKSIFSFKSLTIINKDYPVILDQVLKISTPVEISVAKQILNVIVGKERSF